MALYQLRTIARGDEHSSEAAGRGLGGKWGKEVTGSEG